MGVRPKIDQLDAKILRTLLTEPRTSFAKIARECGLSTTSIRNRFNRMKKSGIINGAIMQINPKSFGYDCVALADIEIDSVKKAGVNEFLENQQIAIHRAHLTGRNNITGFIVAKDTDELSRIVKQIQRHPNIRSVSTAIWIDMINMDHPENLIIETFDKTPSSNMLQLKENMKYVHISEPTDIELETNRKKHNISKQLDKIDIALIKLLTKNARLSFRNIAKKLGISPNNVIKRYKELKGDILPFSSITVNQKKLGYIGSGVISIKVSNQHSVDETFDRILRIPNVIVAIKLFGISDILVVMPFRTLEDLDNLIEELSNISGVTEIDTRVDRPYIKWPLNMISELIIKKL